MSASLELDVGVLRVKSTVENLEPTKVNLTVTVDYDELSPQMAEAYKEIGSQVNIPGFRKGHIPARVIDQRFGRGMVIEQVVNQVLPEYLSQAVVENKLRPLGEPHVEVKSVPNTEGAEGGELVFDAELSVVPDFELPKFEGRAVEVESIAVSDEDVEAELLELRGRFASLRNLDRPAADGDFLTLDITATIDGEQIDSLSDVSYELGSATMLDGQDEALRGASAGDQLQFTSTILGGDHEGSDALIDVTVQAVKERELPEVDDDFAQMVSEFDTADELREDTSNQVREQKKGQQALQARDQLLESLMADVEILLPESVIDSEVTRRVGEDASDEEKATTREAVEKDIRQQLFLDTLAQDRQIKVSQQELIDFMMQTSRQFGMDINQMFQDQQQIQSMYAELARTKGLVSVLADTKVTDASGEVVDLSAFTVDRAKAEEEAAAKQRAAEVQESGEFALNVDEITDSED